MGTRISTRPVRTGSFPEKRFYLDEFHEKTVLFALAPGAIGEPEGLALSTLFDELVSEEVRVVVIGDRPSIEPLEDWLGARAIKAPPAAELRLDFLVRLWGSLRTTPAMLLHNPLPTWPDASRLALRIAGRLRVHKAVLVDPLGRLGDGALPSFLDEKTLESLLNPGEAESLGLGERRHLIESIREGLLDGIPSISLCGPAGLERELYTYEGSGTLFTFEDYCRVDPLGIDDFAEVERLLERGQREGFLKKRSRTEIAQILFTGYGAWIGSGHLAGIGSLLLEPYASEAMGEIVALYTITRFQGEGVGARILERIVAEANRRGLEALFACTLQPKAMQFFERHSFERVGAGDVPAAKWLSYDAGRREEVAVYRRRVR